MAREYISCCRTCIIFVCCYDESLHYGEVLILFFVILLLRFMTKKILTQSGYNKLAKELEERTTVIRQKIADAIAEAKEQGDLSENAAYSAARALQAENEQRIAEIEHLIKYATIAEKKHHSNIVQLGSTIIVRSAGKEMRFELVGVNEVDPKAGKISNESPIGKAFMGRSVGHKVDVATPSGIKTFEILSIV